jgi:hypothetical protein
MNPFENEKDKLAITNDLGLKIVQELQSHVRIMPPNLVASIILLQRNGINEDDLERKVKWLG